MLIQDARQVIAADAVLGHDGHRLVCRVIDDHQASSLMRPEAMRSNTKSIDQTSLGAAGPDQWLTLGKRDLLAPTPPHLQLLPADTAARLACG